MNFKKIFLLLIPLLTFLCIGTMLSNIESGYADELLEAHGLTNNTRYFRTDSDESVSSFLRYLDKNYKHHQIQLHLDSNYEKDQVLVWANHSVKSLPTESGRYFSPDDFKGTISFAVLGPATKTNLLDVQNNKYVILGQHYYSVIGEFKDYPQVEMNKYYLSTGIDQPTAKDQLKNYRIVVDGAPNVISRIAKHYNAKLHIPSFVQEHHRDRLSILPDLLLMLAALVVGIVGNLLLATIIKRQAKLTHLHGDLLRNWVINRSVRLFMIEGVFAIAVYFFLRWHAFYSTYSSLRISLLASWIIYIVAFCIMLRYLVRKDRKVARITK
ncbi:ABC transporter permease [Lactobacillus ultunensis]|uniref:MacB-like periplasmic core domain-containing protein n=1 Tax=Lactobacillus ultunensis DSM 16047 TaxID=525365 RepID=C2EK56_9LACO|nr:ABC transporter permease [Lactobacillus ultunensis]EEJ73071.1 hypothetical protein HMPREF0548_0052 [Lactobacillus ultunensis DSM 16047]QQP29411.1 ABC transporter permease [Lactobacillus ultunensis]